LLVSNLLSKLGTRHRRFAVTDTDINPINYCINLKRFTSLEAIRKSYLILIHNKGCNSIRYKNLKNYCEQTNRKITTQFLTKHFIILQVLSSVQYCCRWLCGGHPDNIIIYPTDCPRNWHVRRHEGRQAVIQVRSGRQIGRQAGRQGRAEHAGWQAGQGRSGRHAGMQGRAGREAGMQVCAGRQVRAGMQGRAEQSGRAVQAGRQCRAVRQAVLSRQAGHSRQTGR
jgi:hypothetical protein